jgi:UDP-N-acetylmuramyl pentapeptide phosphotransferase/UDP-N-acetylglucosamine-1-phosphate transferase
LDNLIPLLLLGVLGAILSWAGVRLIRNYARSRQWSDGQGETAIPRGGGLAIVVVVLLIFMPVGLSLSDPSQVVRFAVSGVLLAMIGFFDDFRNLRRFERLIAQTLAALIFIPAAPITEIGLPFLNLRVPDTLSYVVSAIWIVGFSNTYNYMDGIDGMAGGQAALAGVFWTVIGIAQSDPLILLLGALIAGTSIGFLIYNLPPASIFMGDVGTTFLGFSIAALPMLAVSRGGSPRLIPAGALIAGLFLFDAALTFFRYLARGQGHNITYRAHLYQRLVQLGDPPYLVTLLYLLLSVGFGIAGIIYWHENTWMAMVICFIACLVLFGWITYREFTSRSPSQEAKRNVQKYPDH